MANSLLAKSNDSFAADVDNYVAIRTSGDGNVYVEGDITSPLTTNTDQSANIIFSNLKVRRLTPTECLRLQGFPDDWFSSVRLNKPFADGPMYKMIGNSMAVNVMSWIGQRISMVESLAA